MFERTLDAAQRPTLALLNAGFVVLRLLALQRGRAIL
jgi:hypothetical protein